LKLILQAIKSWFSKLDNRVSDLISTCAELKKKLKEVTSVASYAKTEVDKKMNTENPSATGVFVMNGCEAINESVALGSYCKAFGNIGFAVGSNCITNSHSSCAIGSSCEARGSYSSAIGEHAKAYGMGSHAVGWCVTAKGDYQSVQGKFNIEDADSQYAHIVGNGNSSIDLSNAYTLDWDGNGWFAGSVEATHIILKSSTEGSTKRFKITVDDAGTLTATAI
jgi:hypothetical protein